MNSDLLFGSDGFFGLSRELSVNLISEMIGLVLSIILISIALEHYRVRREAGRWRASRQRIAADVEERHEASIEKLIDSVAVFQETGRKVSGGLFPRIETALESTTRYYERNVFFLLPKSLAHFENYRFEYKKFVTCLRSLIQGFEFDETPDRRAMKNLTATDFSSLDAHLIKFCKSLGRRRPTIDTARSAQAALEALLALPSAELRHVLGTPTK